MSAPAAQPAGPRVLVTRPAAQAEEWVLALRARGVDACALPLIGIAPVADAAALDEAWRGLQARAMVMFVSPNAALEFFSRAPRGAGWPASVRAASPGPGTSAVLRRCGVPPACIVEPAVDAEQFDSEALWRELDAMPWDGLSVLVVAGEGGRDWLARRLLERGARVDRLEAYRRTAAAWTPAQDELAHQALAEPGRHLWFFSSSEAVAHLTARHPPPAWRRSSALATHPRIAQAAGDAGFALVLQARPLLDAVVACIQSPPNTDPP